METPETIDMDNRNIPPTGFHGRDAASLQQIAEDLYLTDTEETQESEEQDGFTKVNKKKKRKKKAKQNHSTEEKQNRKHGIFTSKKQPGK